MSKYTPGPWWFSQRDEQGRFDIGRGDYVLFCSTGGPLPKDLIGAERANARLIAAAPDLLEALKECLASLDRINGWGSFVSPDRLHAREAIAKAEGKS